MSRVVHCGLEDSQKTLVISNYHLTLLRKIPFLIHFETFSSLIKRECLTRKRYTGTLGSVVTENVCLCDLKHPFVELTTKL